MSKITSKYQVSIPRRMAEKLGLRIGDELEWEEAAGTLRVRTAAKQPTGFTVPERLRLFDAASARQTKRDRTRRLRPTVSRGWSRDDLYRR